MLSEAEKVAGRNFREAAQAKLMASFDGENPPDYTVPNFIALYRHNCPERENRSTALELKEMYVASPEYNVHILGIQQWVPAGRFGFIYREGRCRGCAQTARSKAGRLVDGWERPPIQGRVARS